jgi:UDP-glucose 4-epimerase
MKKYKALVTGGAGFIGSNLAKELLDQNWQVSIIDNFESGKMSNIPSGATVIQTDLRYKENRETIFSALRGVDYVFHLAALPRVQPSIDNPIEYHDSNVNATLNMLNLAEEAGVKRFVFSSTSAVYGNTNQFPTSETADIDPLSPYGLHKLIGENYCKLFSKIYDIETVSLRYFNVFGDNMPLEGAYTLVMGVFAEQLRNGLPMTIRGDGEQRRDFIHVKDVAQANILAATSKKVGKGECINIGSGQNKSVNEIANLMGKNKVNVDPVIEPRITLCDNTLAKKLLNWQAQHSLEDFVPWWLNKLGIN